ncbi:membrane protein insertase YidC [Streptomyces sp. SID3343]|uniref:YidC/Oxa1 family membrane protein insertase n=1 Tax=Streptomyces sp. SID3343 TaxID=2690260 RepID=UPI00136A3712|nr:membrane protein insertase YidC [Streptomyces sp. SID3343]MYV98745.1 membrane protein insertase YidC [Streptomyces sp. SID3343]
MLGIPVLDLAHDFLLTLADAIAPLLGTGSVAGAVVLFTACVRLLIVPLGYAQARAEVARARLAPHVRRIRERHAKDPQRAARELSALHREAGTSMFAGILPALAGLPFLFLTYRLFSGDQSLLRHSLFGAPLGLHPLDGLFGPHALVLFGLLALIATVGFVGYRRADAEAPALVRWMPFGTVVTAMFVPLAAGMYLLTSAAWTTAERPLLKRLAQHRDQGVVPGH